MQVRDGRRVEPCQQANTAGKGRQRQEADEGDQDEAGEIPIEFDGPFPCAGQ
jgi:hypothetical protein